MQYTPTNSTIWARQFLNRDDAVVLDTETTGLGNDAEPVEIAIIDTFGKTLLNTRICPIGQISEGASKVHGITMDDVKNAPTFRDIYQYFCRAVASKHIIIYNQSYDKRILKYILQVSGLASPQVKAFHCAMHHYSAWMNEPSLKGAYKWQKLEGGDHSALGDCLATLNVMEKMANDGRFSATA